MRGQGKRKRRRSLARNTGRARFALRLAADVIGRRWSDRSTHRGLEVFERRYQADRAVAFTPAESSTYFRLEGCINCGLCVARCVLLRSLVTADERYAGPRAIAISLSRNPSEYWSCNDTLYYCSLCRACEAVCPMGVPLPDIVGVMRARVFGQEIESVPVVHRTMVANLRQIGNIYGVDLEPIRYHTQEPEYIFFVGCVHSYLERESIFHTMRLLDRLRIQFTTVTERCCGGPCEVAGVPFVPELAEQNMAAFRQAGSRRVITACPRCASTLSTHPAYVGLEVEHTTALLASSDLASLGIETGGMVTYHDPCELGRGGGQYEPARQVIRRAIGAFIEMEYCREMSDCCGAGGGLRGYSARLSIQIARRRLLQAIESGADILLTECPACLHNFRNAKRSRDRIDVYNLSEYLALLSGDDDEDIPSKRVAESSLTHPQNHG